MLFEADWKSQGHGMQIPKTRHVVNTSSFARLRHPCGKQSCFGYLHTTRSPQKYGNEVNGTAMIRMLNDSTNPIKRFYLLNTLPPSLSANFVSH